MDKVKARKTGNELIVTIGTKVFKKKVTEKQSAEIKTVIKAYEKAPTEYRLRQIKAFFKTEKAAKEEVETAVKKGKAKLAKKEVKEEIVKEKNVKATIQELAQKVSTDGLSKEEIQSMEDIIKSVQGVLDAAKKVEAPKPTEGYRRSGEH